jgi:hypothetical protein
MGEVAAMTADASRAADEWLESVAPRGSYDRLLEVDRAALAKMFPRWNGDEWWGCIDPPPAEVAGTVMARELRATVVDIGGHTAGANMYGCMPCPSCGSQYRCPDKSQTTVTCDDCGHIEYIVLVDKGESVRAREPAKPDRRQDTRRTDDKRRERIAARQPTSEKVAHVKRAGQTRDHGCHWPGCKRQVPPAMWGCKEHWFRLPKDLRDKIWASYRPGQEDTLTPSRAYLDVADEVQRWIRAQESVNGGPPGAKFEAAAARVRAREGRRYERQMTAAEVGCDHDDETPSEVEILGWVGDR